MLVSGCNIGMSEIEFELTIIIACFNSEKTIRRCILSFLEQEPYQGNVRLLVVDDGSTDDYLVNIVDLLNHPSVILIKKNNGGVSSARNEALDIACNNSKYVSFLDADDFLSSNYCRSFYDSLSENKPDIIEFNINRVTHEGKSYLIHSIVKKGFYRLKPSDYDVLSHQGHWFACSRIYSSDLFKNMRFELDRRFEDVLLIPLLYSKATSCYGLEDPLYNYVDSDTAFTNNVGPQSLIDYIYFYNKVDTGGYENYNVKLIKSKAKKSIFLYMGKLSFRDFYFIIDPLMKYFKVNVVNLVFLYILSFSRNKLKVAFILFRSFLGRFRP